MESDPNPPAKPSAANPAVSVVLPIRDAATTLDAALESVLVSRDVNFELICIDDGSTDSTPLVLARHARRDPRVVVLTQPALGIVRALNRGLIAARAPLVARMDADDEIHPERLARQAAALASDAGLGLIGCCVESFREGGLADGYRIYTDWVNGLLCEEAIAREAFVECPVPHPTWMLRTKLTRELGGYRDRSWPEDLDLLYRLLAAGVRIGKLPETLYRWRDHPERLSRRDPRYAKEAFARAKAHFVPKIHPLAGAVVWGAGRTGRRWVRLLEAEGVATVALIDINPARIGQRWRGIPIYAPSELAARAPGWIQNRFRIHAAVASRGARQDIRRALRSLGLCEGSEFLMVA